MPGVSHQGTPVQYEDTLGVDGDAGVQLLGFRNDAEAVITTADLSHSRVSVDDTGRLNANANMQVGDADVANGNPVPMSDAGGSVTVDQSTHDSLNANANIQVGDTDVSASNPVPVTDTWTLTLIAEETANDNDKTLTVPASTEYQIMWIYVEYASDATVGDRQLEIDFRDAADDVIGQVRPNVTQAASLTYYYMVGPSMANLTAAYDTDYLMTPMPPTIFLSAGYDIRIFDNNNVAATDDMVIQMMVASRAV